MKGLEVKRKINGKSLGQRRKQKEKGIGSFVRR
jgi:hypothetical protein